VHLLFRSWYFARAVVAFSLAKVVAAVAAEVASYTDLSLAAFCATASAFSSEAL